MTNTNLKIIMAIMAIVCLAILTSSAGAVYWSNLNSLNSSEINVTTLRAASMTSSVSIFSGLNVSGNAFFTGNGIVVNLTNHSSVLDANSTWMHSAYPSACSANYAVSGLGDTNTCSDDWVNEGGDIITGNITFNNNATLSNMSRIFVNKGNTSALGCSRFGIYGTDSNCPDGPHLATFTNVDQYPLLYMVSYTHDNIGIAFDSFFDTVWKSSDVGSNYKIYKFQDKWNFDFAAGHGAGSAVTWATSMFINSTGAMTVNKNIFAKGNITTTAINFKLNTTALSACDVAHEGDIRYDSTAKKHVGCNSTNWTNLY